MTEFERGFAACQKMASEVIHNQPTVIECRNKVIDRILALPTELGYTWEEGTSGKWRRV